MGAVALRPEWVAEVRRRQIVWIAGGAALCAMSSPVVMTAAPLAMWQAHRAIRIRNWKMLAVMATLLGGILIQGLVNLAKLGSAANASALFLPNLPLALVFPGFLRCFLGETVAKFLAAHYLRIVASGTLLLMAALLILLARRLPLRYLLSALVIIIGPSAMAIAGRHIVWGTWKA
jgi:hypothetical protein